MTQSATSAAVAALEERHATKLFDRIGRRMALTEAGRLFLKEAKAAVLARASAAAKVLTDLADLTLGLLALAASQTVANYWLPVAIQSYRLRYPGVIVSTTIGSSENVAAMVHEGSADLGLVEAAIDDPTLVIAPVAEDELISCCAANQSLGSKNAAIGARIEARTLGVARARLRYAIGLRGCAARPWFNEQGSQRRARAPTNEAGRAAVTVISRLVVASSIKAGNLVPVKFPLLHRRFFALRHNERYVSHAEQVCEASVPQPSRDRFHRLHLSNILQTGDMFHAHKQWATTLIPRIPAILQATGACPLCLRDDHSL